ncbi:MAG: OsmC family protein [Sphingobacteriales bacterium]|jgi:putative redox protein|nr:OsmC family protein [Sphingobacteriales bacterium]
MPSIHQTSTRFVGKMEFETEINGHHLILDTTETNGGENKGPSPKPLILSSLAGCTGIDVVSLLNKMHVSYSDFNITVEADLGDEHPKMYTEIRLTYFIKTDERDKMEKAVQLSLEKYCGVSAMLRKVCPIIHKIVFL